MSARARRDFCRVAGAVWVLLAVVGPLPAENPASQARTASEYVSEALQAETNGKNGRREGLLQAALEASPNHAAARWHSGYVRADNRWVKFDEVPALLSQDQRLATYRRLRANYAETVDDQLALARWCKKAKLDQQWRAHLGNVLQLNPDHQEARALLGYRLVDGIWLTPEEIERANARAAAAVAALKQWRPKLLEIREALQQRVRKQQETAQQRFNAIEDPAAIPAIEMVFCGDSEPMALAGMEKIAAMSAGDASLALARQALFSPWATVRQSAEERLKSRERETYVPALLSAMGSPVQSRVELFEDPGGRLLYRHVFFRQGQQRDELLVLDRMYNQVLMDDGQRTVDFGGGTRATFLPSGKVQMEGRKPSLGAAIVTNLDPAAVKGLRSDEAAALNRDDFVRAAQADAAAKAQAREMAIARQNAVVAAFNGAVCRLLSAATGANVPPSSEAWSTWWVEANEVYVPGYKPVAAFYQQDRRSVVTRDWNRDLPFSYHSCLAAGTPVWTDAGPVAIEKIKVGDRVLSQHADTGELAYKPVLHTTVREDAELVKLELLDDAVTCSPGHPFWISGKGWLKAGDIRPNMHFHGAAGTTPLHGSKPAGVGSVYNLIVADFHSYFVGDALIYSHDITARRPSETLVPGLPAR